MPKTFEKLQNFKYQYIDWLKSDASLPNSVKNHPLWSFHQALASFVIKTEELMAKQYWALASVKSLIEIDLNRQFVIQAGLAYERDVANTVYVENPKHPGFYDKVAGKTSEFAAFRKATSDNVQPGDWEKGDILRTSAMYVSSTRIEFISYHPFVSYPTIDLAPEKRAANKEQQIKYFYSGLQQIWQRIGLITSPADQKKCLMVFCENVKAQGIGCANERLGEAIYRTTQELIKYETKELSMQDFYGLVQEVKKALIDNKGEPHKVFTKFLKTYSGFRIHGEPWTISAERSDLLAVKLIDVGIELAILDENENSKEIYLSRLKNSKTRSLKSYQVEFSSLVLEITTLRKTLKHQAVYAREYSFLDKFSLSFKDELNGFFMAPSIQNFKVANLNCETAIQKLRKSSVKYKNSDLVENLILKVTSFLDKLITLSSLKSSYPDGLFSQPKLATKPTTTTKIADFTI